MRLFGFTLIATLLGMHAAVRGQTVEWTVRKDFLKQNVEGIELLGQGSRFTDNRKVDFGRNSFCQWEVDVTGLSDAQRALALPMLRNRWMFGANRDARNGDDENLADHLRHGSVTSGDWGQYGNRVYLARGRVLDDRAGPLTLEDAAKKHPEVSALLKMTGVDVVIRATSIDAPASVSQWFADSWGGQQKEIVMPDLPGWQITGFSIKARRIVNSFWVHYVDPAGREYHRRFGDESDWKKLPTFKLDGDERIVRIAGRARRRLDQIQFHTNKGRSSPIFGSNKKGSVAFDVSAPKDARLLGIQFRSGNAIDRIRFVWR